MVFYEFNNGLAIKGTKTQLFLYRGSLGCRKIFHDKRSEQHFSHRHENMCVPSRYRSRSAYPVYYEDPSPRGHVPTYKKYLRTRLRCVLKSQEQIVYLRQVFLRRKGQGRAQRGGPLSEASLTHECIF